MIILKRKFLCSLLLVNSTLTFAGTLGSSQDLTKGFFVTGAPIYGSLSDEGINKTLYAETIFADGSTNSHQINLDSRWGFLVGVGYKFGPQMDHDVTLTYTNLKNKGFNEIGNTGTNGVIVNRLSQIAQTNPFFNPTDPIIPGGQQIRDATAAVSSHYDFQTVELLTHRFFQSTFLNNVHFSRYYGIKASEFKKGFSADYEGTMAYVDVEFNPLEAPLDDQIDYSAKYFGIGPQIGMGATWSLNRYISLVGDVSAALLGGSYSSKWDEDLNTTGIIPNYPGIVSTTHYSYEQATPTTLWASVVVGSNLAIAAQIPFHNGSSFGIKGGINTEQYWSHVNADAIRSSGTQNTLVIAQRFAVRDVFIKMSYMC
ncbi:Lpg1974 family pore-forming outer membrane protein [Fluoribacter dumoffii]|uniref:Opacity protein and related surface antigens n=1 Tax=Fluoribacter dumoffii TaxID=463 RepID=A0A377GDH3_9GAMM|nr:Lpg1974 family pore-forming outer membrane protein [Fluoribacter dumoffii]KTC91168.1 hypothetical protein Ldum_2236 [Fluoribacter dumoffii NY 23]MCW8387664.1 Lpg1974 family pore-forming outer membrane protein [Fluoribacter dumoffii]MCW8497867.1 Lpg1974 family pore-forming outer membrane protein [Fluoribacter dumoffii]STO22863.1 Uncharacterised protein [Fluoribacter dumoffii]